MSGWLGDVLRVPLCVCGVRGDTLAAFVSDVYALPGCSICVTSTCCSGPSCRLEQEVAKPIFGPQGAGLAHPSRRVAGSQGARAELAKGPTHTTCTPAHAVKRPYIIRGILSHSLRRQLNTIIPARRCRFVVVRQHGCRRVSGTATLTDPTDAGQTSARNSNLSRFLGTKSGSDTLRGRHLPPRNIASQRRACGGFLVRP